MTDICTATGGARYNCNLPPTVSRRSRGRGGGGWGGGTWVGAANGEAMRFVTRLGAGLKDAERSFCFRSPAWRRFTSSYLYFFILIRGFTLEVTEEELPLCKNHGALGKVLLKSQKKKKNPPPKASVSKLLPCTHLMRPIILSDTYHLHLLDQGLFFFLLFSPPQVVIALISIQSNPTQRLPRSQTSRQNRKVGQKNPELLKNEYHRIDCFFLRHSFWF